MKYNVEYYKKFIRDTWIAFRPFSLTLAVGSTGLGIVAAYRLNLLFKSNPIFDFINIVLIIIAGILAQSGANLINDYFEGSFRYYRTSSTSIKFLGVERAYFDVYVFLLGMACFGGAALIGIYLILITNYQMFIIGLTGIIFSYAYTGEPFVYKRHGLGAIFSFIIMGPLMVYGAFFPFGLEFSWYPILLALPASFLIPALMLSNEMRDFMRDTRLSVGTLSVRIGKKPSIIIYSILVFGAFALTAIYVAIGFYPPASLLVFATLPTAIKAFKNVSTLKAVGIPYTNSLHWKFTLILILALIIF